MGIAAERLVKDRFAEFKAQASSLALTSASNSGTRTLALQGADLTGNTVNPFGSVPANSGDNNFMREFFTYVKDLQGLLEKGRSNVKLMGVVLEEAMQATTQDREQEVSDRLQNLVQETNSYVAEVKQGLELLKAKSEEEATKKPNSAQTKIRTNMQQAMAKKHQQLLLDFQKAQVDFKRCLEARQAREMQLLMPEASDEQREAMIKAGETAALVVAKKMAGTHALLLDEVKRIQEKHQDILRLEASISDLAQMFQEMAVLVDAQGEMLDAIEVHVQNTKGYVEKGEENLGIARKAQHEGRKWMCCLTVFVVVVLLIILGPILIR